MLDLSKSKDVYLFAQQFVKSHKSLDVLVRKMCFHCYFPEYQELLSTKIAEYHSSSSPLSPPKLCLAPPQKKDRKKPLRETAPIVFSFVLPGEQCGVHDAFTSTDGRRSGHAFRCQHLGTLHLNQYTHSASRPDPRIASCESVSNGSSNLPVSCV